MTKEGPLDPTPGEPGAELLAKHLPGHAIERRIGSGGMGEVFVARRLDSDQRVAVKLLRWADPDALFRFKREFRALADARHENLVALGELVVEAEGPAFFTMELVEGRPFVEHVRGHTPVGEQPNLVRLARAFRQLAIGVRELHARGCIHRDLKPSNVLITREGRVVILDFGLIAESRGDRAATRSRKMLGTPAYMAPEQGQGEAGMAADLYAIGVMLFECLTGARPFRGAGLDVVMAKLEHDAPDPAERDPTIPRELAELCRRLLATSPSERATIVELLTVVDALIGKAPRAESGPLLRATPFVGRDDQLAALAEAHAAIRRTRRPVTVQIRGRSGQGKSALLARFLDELDLREDLDTDERPPMILRGRIYERESVPYKGIDSIVDALRIQLLRLPEAELMAVQPRHVAPLARMFPVLGDLWGKDGRKLTDFDPAELREQGLTALRELLTRLGDRRTLIVSIDDFQWADVDSARVLAQLLRPPDPPVVLWLIAFRSEDRETSEALASLAEPENRRGRDLREIELGPLSESEALRLAASLFEGRKPPEPARLAIAVRRAAGSPFYLGQAVLSEPDETSDVISLDRLVARRVVALSPDERELLGILAVAGGPIEVERVELCAERAGLAPLATLLRLGLVQRSGPRLEITHDRIREVMVGELEAAELRGIHHRLALALEQTGGQPEALAKHFEGAGQPEQAAEWTERAAELAIAAVAFGRAVELLRRTLSLLPKDASPQRRQRVEAALAEQLANLGRGLEASARFVELAGRTWSSEARAYRRRGAELLLARGRVDEGTALFTTTLRELDERLPQGWLAMLRQIVWERLRLALRGDGFVQRAERELDPRVLERIDTFYAAIRALSGQELVLAFALQSRAFRLALDAGEPRRLVEFHVYESVLAATGGDRRRGERLGAVARTLVEQIESPYLEALIEFHRVIFEYFLVGDCRGAGAMRALKLRLEGVPGSQWMQPNLSIWSASSRLQAGAYVDLLRECPSDLALARERGNPQEIADLSSLLAIGRIHTGELDGARPLLDQARAAWTVPHVAVPDNQIALAEATLRMWEGDFRLAAVEAERSLRALRRWMVVLVLFLRYSLADASGRAYASLVIADPSDRHARRRALAHARGLRRVREQPRCRGRAAVIEAALHSAVGRDALACVCWIEAEREFEACGLEGHLAAVRARLGARLEGSEGESRLARANAYFAAQGIGDPARYVAILAPARADAS
ncbi:protein kinase domain-containing protein [Nannocystaceae bacterium ST9]